MRFKHIFFSFALAALLSSCGNSKETQVELPRYDANWESLKTYECPAWFRDAKFGIFIHWGPYSVPAFGSEWYPRQMYMDTAVWDATAKKVTPGPSKEYLYHVEHYGDPGKFGYKDFIPMFKAEKFNANEWVSLFKKAGAKYVVPVAEHHDGFAMYKSNITRWNSVDMGPKRDVLAELSSASKKQGLYFGASSHFAFNWNYYNRKEGFDTNDPQYSDLYNRNHDFLAPVDEEGLKLWWDRTQDIIDNYNLDILWFDFVLDHDEFIPYHAKLASYFYNKGAENGKEVVLQTKNFSQETFPPGTNVWDIERGKSADILELPWQTDTSIGKNSWCYVKNWLSKTPNSLIDDLIDIVSKNGNMLLNVGPKADGTIPADQAEVLTQMGTWLDVNGEAIYGSRPWVIFGEGPTEVKTGHHTEGKNKDLTHEDFRFTTKGNCLYAIAMDWTEDGEFMIKSLGTGSEHLSKEIIAVSLLGSSSDSSWERTSEGLKIKVSGDRPTLYASTFKIELK